MEKQRATNNESYKRRYEKRKFSSKKEIHTITKRKEQNSTIDKKYDNYGNKVSMYETVK